MSAREVSRRNVAKPPRAGPGRAAAPGRRLGSSCRSSPASWRRRRAGDGWVHELKYDGYRIGCRIDRGGVQLLSRNGKDWTERFAPSPARR